METGSNMNMDNPLAVNIPLIGEMQAQDAINIRSTQSNVLPNVSSVGLSECAMLPPPFNLPMSDISPQPNFSRTYPSTQPCQPETMAAIQQKIHEPKSSITLFPNSYNTPTPTQPVDQSTAPWKQNLVGFVLDPNSPYLGSNQSSRIMPDKRNLEEAKKGRYPAYAPSMGLTKDMQRTAWLSQPTYTNNIQVTSQTSSPPTQIAISGGSNRDSPKTQEPMNGQTEIVELMQFNGPPVKKARRRSPIKKTTTDVVKGEMEKMGFDVESMDERRIDKYQYRTGFINAIKSLGGDPDNPIAMRTFLQKIKPNIETTVPKRKVVPLMGLDQSIDIEPLTPTASTSFSTESICVESPTQESGFSFFDHAKFVKVVHLPLNLRISENQDSAFDFDVCFARFKPVDRKQQEKCDCLVDQLGMSHHYVIDVIREKRIATQTNTNVPDNDEFGHFDKQMNPSEFSRKSVLQPSTCTCTALQSLDVSKCLDCNSSKDNHCRFSDFRRIQLNPDLTIGVDFEKMIVEEEEGAIRKGQLGRWLPQAGDDCNLDVQSALCTLKYAGPMLQQLISDETTLLDRLKTDSIEIVGMPYYRRMDGIRELCDVCLTTIFNLHLLCKDCAFAVCYRCIQLRTKRVRSKELPGLLRDKYGWRKCTREVDPVHSIINLCPAHLIPDLYPQILFTLLRTKQEMDNQLDKFASRVSSPSRFVVDAPHRFRCNGNLLILTNHDHPNNMTSFQNHWSRSLPVVVEVETNLNLEFWELTTVWSNLRGVDDSRLCKLVDCRTHQPVKTAVSYAHFIKGFYNLSDRPKALTEKKEVTSMDLKLKDFPPRRKFSDALPCHFKAYCDALPLREYTLPHSCNQGGGKLNLANLLPESYCKPDLGPKMYVAYSMLEASSCATTNLHCDISDAVNILVNVTVPKGEEESVIKEQLNRLLIREGFEGETLDYIMQNWKKAGALWTIFTPEDSKRIRDFFNDLMSWTNKSLNEIYPDLLNYPTRPLTKMDDPIHDQNLYISHKMRDALRDQYGVEACTFVQMRGDAVFIPAGAPHQVQNLLSCVKVAEDFVSPEGLKQSGVVTEQFKNLTRNHLNKEDKLQLCNIVYHSARRATSVLLANQSLP